MRFRKIWVTIGWMMLVFGALIGLFTSPTLNIGFDSTGKDLHVLFFFVAMVWFGQLYGSTKMRLVIAASLAMFGIGIEVLQSLGDLRVGSLSDVVVNLVGIGCGWLALATRLNCSLLWLDRRLETVLDR